MAKRKKKATVGWKRKGKKHFYYFKESVAKRFGIKKIEFVGFQSRPVGLSLYTTGGGFNRKQSNKIGGDFVLDFLKSRYKSKQTRLTISNSVSKKCLIKVSRKTISLRMSFDEFQELIKDLGSEIRKNRESVVERRLSSYFPKEFDKDTDQTANSKLSDINLNNLDSADRDAVGHFIKRYISINAENDLALKSLQTDLLIQGKKVTLEKVIKKFERHLKNKNFNEKKWQKFLHEEVFFFISNYIESIREADVNFGKNEEGAKKPDFVWIDLYGFLDVFEIKTPFTDILSTRIDGSHKNYYFSSSTSKAVSQIEKYILFLEKNVENFEKYLSKQTKIPFSVLKPKAFLIIGNSREIDQNDGKKKDFRLLRRSLKNIEFITFNELLDNLKNLSSKFKDNAK